MRYNRRFLGIVVLLIALILAYYNSLSITGFAISDSNPYTYSVVVMLMGMIFLFLGIKEKKLEPTGNALAMVCGTAIIAAYIVVLAVARASLSFWFMTYRIDVLLIPIFLLGAVVAIFGREGVYRLKYQIAYMVLASGLIIEPLVSLNSGFTNFNAGLVYSIIKSIGVPVLRNGLSIYASSSSSIAIATTCADIAAFIALGLFLLPLLYFYEGKASRKIAWLVSGIALLFVLNIFRMMLIAVLWAYYGIGEAVATFHIFIGSTLFYASIIIMILLANRFGIRMPFLRDYVISRKKVSYSGLGRLAVYGIAVGIIALVVTLPYSHSIDYGYYNFSGNLTHEQHSLVLGFLESSLTSEGYSVAYLGNESGKYAFELYNGTVPGNYLLLFNYSRGMAKLYYQNNSVGSEYTYIIGNGVSLVSFAGNESNISASVDQFSFPYNVNGRYVSLNYYFVGNSTAQKCRPAIGPVNQFETSLYNALLLRTNAPEPMCAAYGYLNSVVK